MNPQIHPTEEQQKEALAAFTATLHSVGANLEAPLRDRAANIQSNAAVLERQESELAEKTARLAKQNQQWSKLADETRIGLKEIGDVQNWAEMLERDLLALEDMMDAVEKGSNDRSENGREDGCENGNVKATASERNNDQGTDDPAKRSGSRSWLPKWR